MIVTEEQVLAKMQAVLAAMKFVFACTNAEMPFAVNMELKDVIERFVLLAPELRAEALSDLVGKMRTPEQGICANRLLLSLIVAYGLGAGLKLLAISRTASA